MIRLILTACRPHGKFVQMHHLPKVTELADEYVRLWLQHNPMLAITIGLPTPSERISWPQRGELT
jgi:hypothetical protein